MALSTLNLYLPLPCSSKLLELSYVIALIIARVSNDSLQSQAIFLTCLNKTIKDHHRNPIFALNAYAPYAALISLIGSVAFEGARYLRFLFCPLTLITYFRNCPPPRPADNWLGDSLGECALLLSQPDISSLFVTRKFSPVY